MAMYRHIETGVLIAFGTVHYPLTDSNNWTKYINGQVFTSDVIFTKNWLEKFTSQFEFIGRISPEQYIGNLEVILDMLNEKTKLFIMMGSETEYKGECSIIYEGRHEVHLQMNSALRKYAKKNDRIVLLDFNEVIKDQSSYTNCINHFSIDTYYSMSKLFTTALAKELKVIKKPVSKYKNTLIKCLISVEEYAKGAVKKNSPLYNKLKGLNGILSRFINNI